MVWKFYSIRGIIQNCFLANNIINLTNNW